MAGQVNGRMLELWAGLALAGLGGLVLAMLVLAAAAGAAWQLFLITSGKTRPSVRRRRRRVYAAPVVPPSLAGLLGYSDEADTGPITMEFTPGGGRDG